MDGYIDDGHKPNTASSTNVFENSTLEWLTRTHISIPLIVFSIISIISIIYGIQTKGISGIEITLLFFSGLLFFSFVEYLMHRFLYHVVTDSKRFQKFVYLAHGIHHDFPKDKARLVMPIPASLIVSFLFFLIYSAIMGVNVYGFLPGFLIGYATYLWVHYMLHAYRPPKNAFKILWVHHAIHHYKQPEKAFGVSSPLWDVIFRTMPSKSTT